MYSPYIFNELYSIFRKTPVYFICLEVSLLLVVLWVIFHKTVNNKNGKKLSEQQKSEILARWKPDPLVNDYVEDKAFLEQHHVTGKVGKRINIDGIDCLNMGSHNYLGLIEDSVIQEQTIASLQKYGVGSCGPRGFYGTVDVHLELEDRLAKFMQMEEAVVYSYGFSTIASAIPAYSKRGDIIFVDEYCNFAIQKGLDASRSKIVLYKHNDMEDLERCLIDQDRADKKNPKKALRTRRFLVVEAIYLNTGEMCPLVEIVNLCQKYKIRLFLDESISFGTLGKSGRGITEHLNVDRKDIDLICGSLEWAVGSIGGFCVGTTFIVDHQRLSGLGYCFSASAPPLLTQASISALDRFENDPKIFKELNETAEKVHKKFSTLTHLKLNGHSISPVKHLYLKRSQDKRTVEKELLKSIVDSSRQNRLALVSPQYLELNEKHCPRASIRLTVNRLLTDDDIQFAFETIERISSSILV